MEEKTLLYTNFWYRLSTYNIYTTDCLTATYDFGIDIFTRCHALLNTPLKFQIPSTLSG